MPRFVCTPNSRRFRPRPTKHGASSPILLLDDVSSELDRQRNEYLFEFLRQRHNQCFITTTHPTHVLLDRERTDYRVEGGRIIPAS